MGASGAALAAALEGLTREGAREAAREELSRQPYEEARPSLLQRGLQRVLEELGEILGASVALPGGRGAVLLLLLLLAAGVALVLTRLGPLQRARTRSRAVDGPQRETAAVHRELAEREAAAGRYAEAVRERLRAVVRELEHRGLLDPRPGRTAAEVARDAGAVVPALAEPLRRAATVFDATWYGRRPADATAYRVLVELDDQVRAGGRSAPGAVATATGRATAGAVETIGGAPGPAPVGTPGGPPGARRAEGGR